MGNRYDERYEIRQARYSDIDDLMEYIDTVWKKGHILGTSREFFEYEFRDGDKVDFIIARDKQHDNIIAGINGFYPCSKDKEHFDICGTMWSVRNDIPNIPMLGVELCKRTIDILQIRSGTGIGNNVNTAIPLQKNVIKDKIDKLDHFYMLNDLPEYTIALVKDKTVHNSAEIVQEKYVLQKIEDFNEIRGKFDYAKYSNIIPYKDEWYIEKRFFKHPIYQYDTYAVYDVADSIKALVTFRRIEVNGSSVLRLVNYTGDRMPIKYLGTEFRKLLKEEEYIDFYCYGFEKDDLEQAGFKLRDEDDENIIPNYFEPFVQKNIEIWFNTSTRDEIVLCKSDGDQDRPSII